MGLFGFLFLCVCLALLAILIGATAVTFGLVIAGIVSSSVLIGALHRDAAAGFRSLVLQLGAFTGLIVGFIVAALVAWWGNLSIHPALAGLIGAAGGILAGLAGAGLLWVLLRLLAKYFVSRMRKESQP
jgi:hypothetical protein